MEGLRGRIVAAAAADAAAEAAEAEPEVAEAEVGAQPAAGPHGDGQDAFTTAGVEPGEGGGHRTLAHPALAGDELDAHEPIP